MLGRTVLLAALSCAACSEPPLEEARTGCKARYDRYMRWVTAHGRAPETPAELEEVMPPDGLDPWGRPYVLDDEAGEVRIWSWGPDGVEGTDDDLCFPPD